MVGTEIKVLIDQPLVARSAGDAPEVDTRVLLNSSGLVGQFAKVKITGTQVYDLRAEICS